MRMGWKGLVATVALGALTNGCCTARLRVEQIRAELQLENVARAEPTMREAARQQGAELLPDQARELGLVPWCAEAGDAGPHRDCVLRLDEIDVEPGVYQMVDHAGRRRFALTIGDFPSTTRLARRGTTFFRLVPRATYRKIGQRTACACSGGPSIVSMSGYVNLGLAFLVDDFPKSEIRQIMVPVVEDYIEWRCKTILV